ncbi:sensor histidine kinase [Sphingomonas endophytica]|uniref:histidine kinase n=1 Tax=Sphingomonas endophytica TaxID=869719 RepID=A0A147HV10_9SPHN|nr:HAMP domain-containing sensor histidine kinase [Sphingomonas endophytica]KTT68719.1 histidine kinase [Sphingomonas endophytica]
MYRSATFRFAALVFILQLASAAALIVMIGLSVRQQLNSDARRTVAVLRDDLRASYAGGGVAGLAREVRLRTGALVTPGTVLLLADRDGGRIAGNLDAWPPSVTPGAGSTEVTLYRSGLTAAEAMHVEGMRLRGGERLLVGTIVAGEARAIRMLEQVSGVALPLALMFASLAAWMAARMIVARLEEPLAALNAVAAGDLGARVPDDGSHDALATLGVAINGALERVETLMSELRMATDGLAHDLKSPLTRMRVVLERAATEVREPAAIESIDRALAEADRLFTMVQTALSITRAEAGIGRETFVAVDLAVELAGIAEMYAPVVEDAGRTLALDVPGTLPWVVHRELLAQALGNLIDNSLKYGAGPVTLGLDHTDGQVRVTVADRGPGIPAARHEDALRRFGRLDDARSGTGAGLGLSLAGAVARLHGGGLVLGDAAPGLVVTLNLGG